MSLFLVVLLSALLFGGLAVDISHQKYGSAVNPNGGRRRGELLKKLRSFFGDRLGKRRQQALVTKDETEIKGGSKKSLKVVNGSHIPTIKGKAVTKLSTISSRAASNAPGNSMKRILREVQAFITNPPRNLELTVDPKNIRSWIVTLTGADGTVYAGEKYRLQMNFSKTYPSTPPSVFFLKPVPKHVHVYSNGDICLNLLGRDWSPTLTGESIALSVLSMLSSAKEKSTPQDNASHADTIPGRQQDGWMYHDDRC